MAAQHDRTGEGLLAAIAGPADLRKLDTNQLQVLAAEIRRCIRETVSRNGGHLASNLGVVELTLALHRVFDFASDRLLFDVGHQAYVHKLVTGRHAAFGSLRTRGGLSGFPSPEESPYDIVRVGHSSTAISTAIGLADGFQRRNLRRKTVVVVGDGSFTGGMVFEGMINGAENRPDLLVILNDNGTFIDQPVGALHAYFDRIRTNQYYLGLRDRMLRMLGRMPFGLTMERITETAESAARRLVSPGSLFEELGFRYFGPVDGHVREDLEDIFTRVAAMHEPVLIHVHTEKGGGWEPSAADPLAFHGPRNFCADTGVFFPRPEKRTTYSEVFSRTLCDLADEDPSLVAVTAAMPTGTGLSAFGERHPDRLIDVGICEQHSFGFVEGMCLAGLRPVLAHYSTFAQRGFDQLFQEICLQRRLGLVLVLDRAGLVGEDGETHQGIYDLAWSGCLPGTVLMAPKDGTELTAMLTWAHRQRLEEDPAAVYIIRYPKEGIPEYTWGLDAPTPIAHGRAEIIRRGAAPLMIWCYGVMLSRVWEALERLGPAGRDVTLVNARFAKPLDTELLAELAVDHPVVLTVEDHVLTGGFGSRVLTAASGFERPPIVRCRGVRDEPVAHATREQQLADHGLDTDALAAAIAAELGLEAGGKVIPLLRRG